MPAPLVLIGLAALGALLFASSSPVEKPGAKTPDAPLPGLGPNDVFRRDDGALVATESARADALARLSAFHLVAEPAVEGSVSPHRLEPGPDASGVSAKDAILSMREQGFDTWLTPGATRSNGLPAFAFVAPGALASPPLAWVLFLSAAGELPIPLPEGFSPESYFMLPGGIVKAAPDYARKTLVVLDRARLDPVPGLASKKMIVQGATGESTALAEVKAAHASGKDIWFTADLLVQGPKNASNPALVFLPPAERPKAMIPGSFVLLLDASEPWPAGVESHGAEFTLNDKGVSIPTSRAVVEARALLALWMQTTTSFSHDPAAQPADFGSPNRPLDITSDTIDARMGEAINSFNFWIYQAEAARSALGITLPSTLPPNSNLSSLTPWLLDALFRVGAAISDTLRGQPAGGSPPVSVVVNEGSSPAVTVRPYTGVIAIVKTKERAVSLLPAGDGSVEKDGESTGDKITAEGYERVHSFRARKTGSATIDFVDPNGVKRAQLTIIVRDEFGARQPVDEDAIVVRSGQSPAFLANYYTGDPARFVELGQVNPALGKLVRRGSGVNFAGWKPGVALKLPANWTKKPAPGASR